jgi:small subunit ribosomal protein S21
MAIRIKARAGESAEQMMRRFKKMCEKEGLTKDIKRRAYYEKPSERKQRALRKSIKRAQQIASGVPLKKGPPQRGGPGGSGGGSRGPGGGGPRGGGGRPAGRPSGR